MLSSSTSGLSAATDAPAFAARYGDGQSASRVTASVTMRDDGLQISPLDGAPVLWPYADLRVAEPIRSRSIDAILTSRQAERASLYVDDTLLLAQLIRTAPQLKLGSERWRTARPGLSVGAAALAATLAIWAFDLSPTKGVARTMPEKARAALGDSVIRTMPAQNRCTGIEGQAALGKLMQRLMPNGPISGKNIIVLDWSLLNAFAVPGNRIVLTRGLIEQAQGPDEIAAVIGHEAGHSIELHPEASLVRSVGFWALVQMVFTGTPGAIGNIGVVLAQLGYTRSAEREADGHALRLLRDARISPKGMGDFFRRMDKRTPSAKPRDAASVGDILSSHPSNPERISRIDSQVVYETTPSLTDDDWKRLKSICANAPVGAPANKPATPAQPSAPETAAKQPTAEVARATAAAAAKAEADKVAAAAKLEALRAEVAKAEAMKREALRVQAANDEAAKARAAAAAQREADKTAAAKVEQARVDTAKAEAARQAELEKQAEAAKVQAAKQTEEKKVEITNAQTATAADTEPTSNKQTVALATGIPTVPASTPSAIDVRIKEATRKISANAQDTAALIERGQAYVTKQDRTAAIEDFSRALALKPADANTLFWRASVYAQQGLLDQAIGDYNDVIRLQPKNFAAYNNRGSLYRAQKKLDLALRDYTAAIAIDGKQAIALTNRALIYRERSDLDAAITDLNSAITVNAGYANAYARRGETHELKSAREAAIADYRAVLRFPEPAGSDSEPHRTARSRLAVLGVKF